jgi:hypothetical protein
MSAFQTVAGASVGSSCTFRGPTRRSTNAAMDVRQLFAAICRSASVIGTCISFSASAKVAGDTSGPTGGAVLKAGGAPGVAAAGLPVGAEPVAWSVACPVGCFSVRHATIAPSMPIGAWIRNCRREFT